MTTVKIPAGSVELSGELVLPPAEDHDYALRFDIDLLTQLARRHALDAEGCHFNRQHANLCCAILTHYI